MISRSSREKSVDATSVDGGFLGKIDPNSLRPELRDALRGVEAGQRRPRAPGRDRIRRERKDCSACGRTRRSIVASGPATLPEAWGQDLHAVCEDFRQSPLKLLKQLDAMADPSNKESPLFAKTTKRLDVMNFYVGRGQIYALPG